jgi:hypothetical protein
MANEQFIRNRRGTLLTTIKPGKSRSISTLVLHGYGQAEFGQLRDNNLVYLLENFYSSTAPTDPIEGQLWWQTGKELFVWTETGSPSTGRWDNVVPPTDDLGFEIVAGDGLTGGGFPTTSPAEVVLNVGAGTGVRVGSPVGFVTVKESEINHDSLDGFVANEHINHTTVTITAGDGLTGGGDITQTRRFDIGAGDGIEVRTNEVRVDDTVLRVGGSPNFQTTTGEYSTWHATPSFGQLNGYGGGGSPKLAFTFINDLATGWYRESANTLVFAVRDRPALTLTSTGVFRYNTGSPITLPTDPDDIVTKGYVDQFAGSAVSPTENTFVGVSTITGLTAGKIYMVTAYGILPSKGTGIATLSAITIRDGLSHGAGTVLPSPLGAGSPRFTPASAFTNAITNFNWFDGNGPIQITMVVKALSSGINIQMNNSIYGGVNTYSSYSVAVELGDG